MQVALGTKVLSNCIACAYEVCNLNTPMVNGLFDPSNLEHDTIAAWLSFTTTDVKLGETILLKWLVCSLKNYHGLRSMSILCHFSRSWESFSKSLQLGCHFILLERSLCQSSFNLIYHFRWLSDKLGNCSNVCVNHFIAYFQAWPWMACDHAHGPTHTLFLITGFLGMWLSQTWELLKTSLHVQKFF